MLEAVISLDVGTTVAKAVLFDLSGADLVVVAPVLGPRAGAELGADWVKVPYVQGFAYVMGVCYKPVVFFGPHPAGQSSRDADRGQDDPYHN